MLRLIKWVLLVLTLALLGFVAADKANIKAQVRHLMALDTEAVGAIPNPDWETINPFGCRYRFNLAPSEFENLRTQQLTQTVGWGLLAPEEAVEHAALAEVRTEDAVVYVNRILPHRLRWVVYQPQTQLLYLGYGTQAQ